VPGLAVLPSQANFFLVRLSSGDAWGVHSALKGRGILVRDVSGLTGLAGCLRVSVGTPCEGDAVVAAFREVLA
jgi:histidinol-phosphate aminotransferase